MSPEVKNLEEMMHISRNDDLCGDQIYGQHETTDGRISCWHSAPTSFLVCYGEQY